MVTYTGFEAAYIACVNDMQASDSRDKFHFPIYQLEEKMTCYLDIHLRERHKIVVNMTIHSDHKDRDCKDIIRIFADGADLTDQTLLGCTPNKEYLLTITFTRRMRLIFTSESRDEFSKGTFMIEDDDQKSTETEHKTETLDSNTNVIPVVVPVTILVTLVVLVTVSAVLYKRGIISVRIPWKSETTYEDPVQCTSENTYTSPKTGQQIDIAAYQNDELGKGDRSSSEQNYYNLGGQQVRETNPEDTYEATEQQYEDHLDQNTPENEHQYSDLKV